MPDPRDAWQWWHVYHRGVWCSFSKLWQLQLRDMTPEPLTKRQSIAIYECHTRRMYQILAAKQRLCSASVDAAAGVKISPGYRGGNALKAGSGSKCDISSEGIRRSH